MVTQKVDPKHPLFKKIVRNRFKAFLFGVPGLIWFMFVVVPLSLDLETEAALILSAMLFANGIAHYLFSVDLNRELMKGLRLNATQVSALSNGE
jgi:hypothetical protein